MTVPAVVAALLGVPVAQARAVSGGDICAAYHVVLADGRAVFAKMLDAAPRGFFAAEAAALRWLAAAPGGVPVPDVLGCADDVLVLSWIPAGSPTTAAAEQFGRALAATHAAGATRFGAERDGFIGSLPLDNAPADEWAPFYGQRRLLPYLRLAVDRGAIDRDGAAVVDELVARLPSLAGPAEPPARIHGDLWSGNVRWGADGRAWLVDPAAHGGHRETDLAMLALFGAPYLDRVIAAYAEVAPLSAGWRDRVPLHQLHPLLVHAALFGGGYGSRAVAVARSLVGAARHR